MTNNKIFISYANEDYEFAKELYDFLKVNNYSPWLDKECLLPGQNWEIEINKALRKADFIILLISNKSIHKRGYVQREYKLALKFYEEKLEDDIFLLPVKIDNCNLPFGFEKFQWLKLGENYDLYKILESLNFQRKKVELQRKSIYNSESEFEYEDKKIIKETGINPKKIIEIYYPIFTKISNEDLLLFNSNIENKVLSIYSNFISPIGSPLSENNGDKSGFPEQDWELEIKYSFNIISEELICLELFTSMYTGGAHGNYWSVGYNYRLNPFMKITIEDIFHKDNKTLKILIKLIRDKIEKYAEKEFGINNIEDFYLSPLKTNWEEINNIMITYEGIIFVFHTYQLTAFALGEHKILISFNELLERFPNSKPLKYLKEKVTTANKGYT